MTLQQLIQLLKTSDIWQQIDAHRDEIAQLIPEVSVMFDYDQNNRYHQYDLWTHTLMTVCDLPDNLDDVVYLAALLHDIGKVESRCRGKKLGIYKAITMAILQSVHGLYDSRLFQD